MNAAAKPPSRSQLRKSALRQEIVDAALDAFAEQGYHATSIADIARRLGIGHGTFYRYFKNKRDIIEHVIDGLVEGLLETLAEDNAPEAVTTLEGYRAQSVRIGGALAKLFGGDPRVPRLLLFEAPGVDAALRERVLDFLDSAADLTAAYLTHGMEHGYLRADLDVLNTARALNGMILGGVVHGVRQCDLETQQAMTKAIQSVMYDGISAPRAQDAPSDPGSDPGSDPVG